MFSRTQITKFKIIVLEDDLVNQKIIGNELKSYGVRNVIIANNLREFKEGCSKNNFDLAFLDVYIGDTPEGLDALKVCNKKDIPAFILSSSDDEEIIEESIENKCQAFLSKTYLKENINDALDELFVADDDNLDLKIDEFTSMSWITSDYELIENIKKVLSYDWKKRPLLITGESGVGKTALIKQLHRLKYGEDSPFVEYNSGGKESDSSLTDTELFGHTSDAFSGAKSDKKGKFDLAKGGTLFFDEIGNISIPTQEKLIKAVDEKTFYPIGSNKLKSVDCSFIFATLKDLPSLVESGEMKHDFYARINGFNLRIKPLRERREDIILIIHSLMKKEKRKFVISEDARDLIFKYDWPYNVRELISEFENWKIEARSSGNVLLKKHLSKNIQTNYNPFKSSAKSLLSQTTINFIKKHGYMNAMSKIHRELVSLIQEKPEQFGINGSTDIEVERKIGIPRRRYKNMVNKFKEAGSQ